MGAGVAADLRKRGFRVLTDLTGRSDDSRRRARVTGMEDAGSLENLIGDVDLFLSILPSPQIRELSLRVAATMSTRATPLLFAEMSAKAPTTSEEMAALIRGAGGHYVDGAITGPPPVSGPCNFLLSGEHAKDLRQIGGGNILVHVHDEHPFAASAIKMCVSAATKAKLATYMAAAIAAKQYGVYETFETGFKQAMPHEWKSFVKSGPRMAAAAERWAAEFDEAAKTIEAAGLPAHLYDGVGEIYRLLQVSPLGAETKETLDTARDVETFVSIVSDYLNANRPTER